MYAIRSYYDYVLHYVRLATLLVTLVALNVRKLVYVKHVVVHSSQNVNLSFRKMSLVQLLLDS